MIEVSYVFGDGKCCEFDLKLFNLRFMILIIKWVVFLL